MGNNVETDKSKQGHESAIEGYTEPQPGGWDGYPLDELAIRDERRTAEDVVRRIKKGRFVLDPEFQRGFVWDPKKQSRLIESILLRIPLPVFYVAEDSEGRLVVVDGRQRLTTLRRFLGGELTLDLEDRPELHAKQFKQLEPRLQNRVEDCQLHFYIIDHGVPERARLDIFERVNGGEVLTRQQMRNAMYNGRATEFLKNHAGSELFVGTTGQSLNVDKMQDREFVNRFCSFSLFTVDEYRGDMDSWLARSLMKMNEMSEMDLKSLGAAFQLGLENNATVFGKHAFRKHQTKEQSRSIINASLYDVMITGLARFSPNEVSAQCVPLRQAFYKLLRDDRFNKAITYGPNTPKEVRTRFEMAKSMFAEVFGA